MFILTNSRVFEISPLPHRRDHRLAPLLDHSPDHRLDRTLDQNQGRTKFVKVHNAER